MPRFAANLSFLYQDLPFLERFGAAADDGFRGVEFMSPYDHAPEAVAEALRRHDLSCVLFNAPPAGTDAASIAAAWADPTQRGTACLPGREDEFRSGIELALRYASVLRCSRLHIMAGIRPAPDSAAGSPAANDAALLSTYQDNLRWAAQRAASQGITVLIEAINTHDMPGYYLNRQQQAHDVVRAVGAHNLRVQMDLYHCHRVEGREGDAVATLLRQYLPTGQVGHIQIAGAPHRHEPTMGHAAPGELDYRPVLKLIDALGWDGWVGCEYRPRQTGAGGTRAGLGWMRAI